MTDDTEQGVKQTLGQMADAVIKGRSALDDFEPAPYTPLFDEGMVGKIDPETAEPYDPPRTLRLAKPKGKAKPDIAGAFAAGAGERASSPAAPKKPAPKTQPVKGTGRPPGAAEMQGLFAAGIITLIAFSLGDWALPTPEEADAFAIPLSNILARRIDVAAKLGADANDTIALAVAFMSYMVRVGPIAAEKARSALDERNQRARVNSVRSGGTTERSGDGRGEDGMVAGSDGPAGPNGSAPYRPLDALAQARNNAWGSLARGAGRSQGPDTAMDH